jgi:hypothetical protein
VVVVVEVVGRVGVVLLGFCVLTEQVVEVVGGLGEEAELPGHLQLAV